MMKLDVRKPKEVICGVCNKPALLCPNREVVCSRCGYYELGLGYPEPKKKR